MEFRHCKTELNPENLQKRPVHRRIFSMPANTSYVETQEICTHFRNTFVPTIRKQPPRERIAKISAELSHIGPGNVLLRNEAFSWVARSTVLELLCSTCFNKRPNLLQCSACKLVKYCNKTCSAHDWKSGGHKRECKHLKVLHANFDDNELDELRLLIRTYSAKDGLYMRNSPCLLNNESESIMCGFNHFTCMSIHAGLREFRDECDGTIEQKQLFSLLTTAFKILKKEGINVDLVELTNCLAVFRTNNFGILDDLFNVVGHGVYPAAALMQHSCNPTCLLTYQINTSRFFSPSLVVISLKRLSGSEELTHSYVDLCQPVHRRQRALKASHNFSCLCARCEEQLCVYSNGKPSLSEKEHEYVSCLSDNRTKPLIIRQLLKSMDEHTTRPHGLVEIVVTTTGFLISFEKYTQTCRQFEQALSNGEWELAADHGRFIITYLAITLRHVSFHPLLGLQLFTLGDICALIAKDSKALSTGKDSKYATADLKYDEYSTEAREYYIWCEEILLLTHSEVNYRSDMLMRLRTAMTELDITACAK